MCCDDRISLCHLAKPFAQLMNFIKLVYGLCFLIDTDYGVINVSLRFLSTIFLSSFFFYSRIEKSHISILKYHMFLCLCEII